MTEPGSVAVRGARTFIAGAIVLLLFGGTHLSAVYISATTPPSTPQEQILDKVMRETVLIPDSSIKTTTHDAMEILSRSYSTLLIFVAIVDLLCWRAMAAVGRLRRLALVNLIFSIILAILPALALFPPPMAFSTIAALLFGYSWLAQRAPTQDTVPVGVRA